MCLSCWSIEDPRGGGLNRVVVNEDGKGIDVGTVGQTAGPTVGRWTW